MRVTGCGTVFLRVVRSDLLHFACPRPTRLALLIQMHSLFSLHSGRRTRVEFSVNITCNEECIRYEDDLQLRRETEENLLVSIIMSAFVLYK